MYYPSVDFWSSITQKQVRMPNFRWPLLFNDLSLVKEVLSLRPNKPADWESIATKLSTLFSTDNKPVFLKGRACKDRLELLLKKYKEEDEKALKRLVIENYLVVEHFIMSSTIHVDLAQRKNIVNCINIWRIFLRI